MTEQAQPQQEQQAPNVFGITEAQLNQVFAIVENTPTKFGGPLMQILSQVASKQLMAGPQYDAAIAEQAKKDSEAKESIKPETVETSEADLNKCA